MYKGKKVSVVFSTYKEKKTIKKVIEDFWDTGYVDEIVVVNNNAQKGTDKEVQKTKAKLVHECRQGYGYGFQRAINEATGDLIVVSEPDGSFLAKDLERFLVYSEGFDVVIGSRTSLIASLSGRGMGWLRKFSNVFEAKTIEVLFNTNALTDVGCTYKLFSRKAIRKISENWGYGDSALFNTQLYLLVISKNLSFVEIPITYLQRTGASSVVPDLKSEIWWGLRIQVYIFYFWLKNTLFNSRRQKR